MDKLLDEKGLEEVWKRIKDRSLPSKRTTTNEFLNMTDDEKKGLLIVMDEGSASDENSNVYSNEEVRIGTWFGKPLYRVAGRTICHPDRMTALITFFTLPPGCIPVKYDIFMHGGTTYPKLPVFIGGDMALNGFYAHDVVGHIGLNVVVNVESYLTDLDLTYIIEYVKDTE